MWEGDLIKGDVNTVFIFLWYERVVLWYYRSNLYFTQPLYVEV